VTFYIITACAESRNRDISFQVSNEVENHIFNIDQSIFEFRTIGNNISIYQNNKKVLDEQNVVHVPTSVTFFPKDNLLILENGFGSGQISYLSVRRGIRKYDEEISRVISIYENKVHCKLSNEFISTHFVGRKNSKIYIEMKMFDRFGECPESKNMRAAIKLDP
jgi:hypothetical protein